MSNRKHTQDDTCPKCGSAACTHVWELEPAAPHPSESTKRIAWINHHGQAAPQPAKAAHTPGPWSIVRDKEAGEFSVRSRHFESDMMGDYQGVIICDIARALGGELGRRHAIPEAEANAELIAAAPETKAELERVKAERKEHLEARRALGTNYAALKEESEQWETRWNKKCQRLQEINSELLDALKEIRDASKKIGAEQWANEAWATAKAAIAKAEGRAS